MPNVSISIAALGGDNLLSSAELANGVVITGTASDSVPGNIVGRPVTVTLGGQTYMGAVEIGGGWSVSVPPAGLAALTNGQSYTVAATVSDSAGNKATATDKLTVDETASLAIKPIDGAGFVNAKNAAAGVTISGTSTGGLGVGDFAGETLTLTLNNVAYTATIHAGGTWSVTIPPAALALLTDGQTYQVSVSATDKAGNSATSTASLTVDESAKISISPIDGANFINGAAATSGLTISGHANDSVLASIVGQSVTVAFDGKSYTGAIQSDGAWSVDVGAADVALLSNGQSYAVTATVTDAAGNKTTATDKVTVDETASLTIKPVDGAGFVNAKNAAAGITILGTSAGGLGLGDFAGETLTLTLNNVAYAATIRTGGNWLVAIPAGALASLTDGQTYQISVSATDKAGNAATSTASLTVDESATISISPIDDANYINGAAATSGLTISGHADDSVLASLVGHNVTVAFDGKSYAGAVQSDGAWSVDVGAADLALLSNGHNYNVTAVVTDAAGNKSTATDKVTVDETASLAIKPIDGAGFVNAKNAAAGITILGTSDGGLGLGDFAGQTLTLTLANVAYTATIHAGGTWSVAIPPAALALLTDGQTYQVSVSATDKAGNAATSTASLTVDKSAALAISPIGQDDVIASQNLASGLTISGTSRDSVPASLVGETVAVAFDGKTYDGSIQVGGGWSVNVAASDLTGLNNGQSYTASASVTDAAGNKASATQKVMVDEIAVTLSPIGDDGYVNGDLASSGIVLSGVATGAIPGSLTGQSVAVTLGSQTYSGEIDGAGDWSVSVGADDIAALTDGATYTATVDVTDKYGSSASAMATFILDEKATLTINAVSQISASDADDGVTITGTADDSILDEIAGQTVTLTLGGQDYSAEIGAGGDWSTTIDGADISALTKGQDYAIQAKVTDKVGNSATADETLLVTNFAEATVGTNPVMFDGVRVGDDDQTAISVTNTAETPAEALDGQVSSFSGGVLSATGSFSGLAAGATSSDDLQVTLDTSNAGDITGAVTLDFTSDGGQSTTPLDPQTVQVEGKVYREATGALQGPDDMIVHVDDNATQTITVQNTADADGYSEYLIGALGALPDGFTSDGANTGQIAAGDSGALTVAINTSQAGMFSGDATVTYQSDGTGLDNAGPTTIGDDSVSLSVTVNNYAKFSLTADQGTLSANDGDSYSLDLGEVYQGDDDLMASLTVANAATGPADLLSGSLAATGADDAFTNDGGFAFSSLDAGDSAGVGAISLTTDDDGTFTETFDIRAMGSNDSGYSGALDDGELTVTGKIDELEPPQINAPASVAIIQGDDEAISISVDDPHASKKVMFTATVSAAEGNLTASGDGVSGSGTTSLTIVGTLAQINAGLATVNDADFSPDDDTVTISVKDQFGHASDDTVQINVTPNPPTVTYQGGLTVTSTQPTGALSVKITTPGVFKNEKITATFTDGSGTLSASGEGVSGAGTNALTITGTEAQVDDDLASLSYTGDGVSDDTIDITVGDGKFTTLAGHISVVESNAGPPHAPLSSLEAALLAMDSYDHGYGANLFVSNTTIGNFQITADDAIEKDGFYALSYTGEGTNVISYRGTDLNYNAYNSAADILFGWLAGGGVLTPQLDDAIAFYQQTTKQSIREGSNSSIVLTGHSLGGGLAGFIGSLTGNTAQIFDSMPFGAAAFLQFLLENAQSLTDPLQIVDDIISALQGKDTSLAPFPDASNVTAISTGGEVLSAVRAIAPATVFAGGLSNALTLLSEIFAGVDGGKIANTIFSALLYPEIAPLAAAAAVALQAETSTIDPYDAHSVDDNSGLSGTIAQVKQAVELHSMGLLVLLQYADDNGHTDWTAAGPQLFQAYNDDDIGMSLGLSSGTGMAPASSQMLTEIAYSTIPSGSLVYGDTGAVSLFHDGDALGQYFKSNAMPSGFTVDDNPKFAQDLANIAVEYAGFLSETKDDDTGGAHIGVINYTSSSQAVVIDVDKDDWTGSGGSVNTPTIVSKAPLLGLLFDDTPLSSKIDDDVSHIVVGGSSSSSSTVDLSDDTGLDLVYGGDGKLTLTTGMGTTDILAAAVDDVVNVSQPGKGLLYVGGDADATINGGGGGDETLDVLSGGGDINVTFGGDETLRIDDPTKFSNSADLSALGTFNGQITGFTTTNLIDLQGLSISDLSFVDDLTVDDSAGQTTLKLVGDFNDDLFQYGADSSGGSEISLATIKVDPTAPSWQDTPSTEEFTITRSGSYLSQASVWVSTVAGDDGFDSNDDDFVAIDDQIVTFDDGATTATVELTVLGGDADDDETMGSSKTFGFKVRDAADDNSRIISDDTFTLTTSPSPWPPPSPPPSPSPSPSPIPISPPPPPPPSSTALGCPHFTTFDGVNFDFQGAGEFIASKSTKPGDKFQVQIRIEPEGSSDSSVSIITQIAVQVGDDHVTFGVPQSGDVARASLVMVDGAPVNISPTHPVFTLAGGVVTEISANEYRVVENTGEVVTIVPFGDGMGLTITLAPGDGAGSVEGFFGSDSGVANSFMLPDGAALGPTLSQDDLYQTFANAWRVSDGSSLLDYAPGQDTETFTNTAYPREILTLADFSPTIVAAAAALVAAAGITDPVLAADAEFDYITMGNPSFIAQDVTVAATGTTGTSSANVTGHSAPPPSLGVLPVAATVMEAAGGGLTAVSFDINLTSATTTTTVVDFAVTPNVDYLSLSGTPGGSNTSGKQFFSAADFGGVLPTGSITIGAGQTTGVVTIEVPTAALGSAPDKWLGLSITTPGGDGVYAPTGQVEVINASPVPGILAQPAIEVIPGPAAIVSQYPTALTKSGDDFTLNLGEIVENESIPQVEFEIANLAPNRADALKAALIGMAGSGLHLTGTQPSGVIAAGSASSALYAQIDTSTLGAQSETLTFSAHAVNDSGYNGALSDDTLTVKDVVVAAASALASQTQVTFGAAHLGAIENQSLSITNEAPAGGATLDVSVSAGSGTTASGSFTQLASGATDSSHINVGLNTSQAGAISGAVTINQFSDLGNGVEVAALPSPKVTVSGDVYRYAVGAVTPSQAILHVGDPDTEALDVTNAASADGFSEKLIATLISSSGAITVTGGATGDIAAGASDDTTLTASFSTAQAGTLTGALTLGYTSDGAGVDGLGETNRGLSASPISIQVNNYAQATLADLTDPSALQRNGDDYTLNLGTVEKGGAGLTAKLEALNSASGLADLLSGSFTLSGDTAAFTNNGLAAFSGLIAAGVGDAAPVITLNTTNVGEFDETLTLHSVGSNASGYSGARGDVTLTLTGDIAGSAPPVISIGAGNSDAAALTADDSTGLAASGTLSFSDPIAQYAHTVSVAAAPGDLGALTATIAQDSEPSGAGGVIDWNYKINEAAAASLAVGQVRVDTFTLTLDDGHGGTATKDVTIDVTGVNAPPVITVGAGDTANGEVSSSVAAATLKTTGKLSFSDPNLIDTHTVSVAPTAGDLGTMTASVSTDSTGTGAGGLITWKYSVSEVALSALGVGASQDDTFDLTVSDGHGGTATEVVTVKATDTAPSFTEAWANASGGSWNTDSNWNPAKIPGADDSALIDLSSGSTVTFGPGDDDTVGAITLQGGGALALAGGALTVDGQIGVVDGSLLLEGGALADATVSTGAGGSVAVTSGTLSDDTFVGPIDLTVYGAGFTVTNGLKVQSADGSGPGTVTLSYYYQAITFEDTQTFDDATIDLDGYYDVIAHDVSAAAALAGGAAVSETLTLGAGIVINVNDYAYLIATGGGGTGGAIVNDGAVNVSASETLTVEAGTFDNDGAINVAVGGVVTIEPSSFVNQSLGVITLVNGASLILANSADDAFVNAGAIDSNGGAISIYDLATFENTGALNIENSTIKLYGDLTPGQFAPFEGENNTIDIYGALTNSGNTLTTGSAAVTIDVETDGVISGGTLQGAGVELTGGLLDDVTVAGPLTLTGYYASGYIANGLTTTGANGTGPGTIDIGNGYGYDQLYFENSQGLDDVTVNLDGYSVGLDIYTTYGAVTANGGLSPLETLTIDDNATVNQVGGQGYLGQAGYGSDGAIINDGAIDVESGTLIVDPAIFDNDGAITVGSYATLTIQPGNFVNEAGGTITVDQNADLTLGGSGASNLALENLGSIVSNGGTLTLYNLDGLTNAGALSLTNTKIDLEGDESDSQLDVLTGVDDTLVVAGVLDNTGQTISAGGANGFARIDLAYTGTIEGGVIDGSTDLELSGGTLDAVTLDGPVTLDNGDYVYIDDGLTLTGAGGAGAGSITISDDSNYNYGGNLYFDNNQTFDNATVDLANQNDGIWDYTTVDAYYAANGQPYETLTLGQHLTIDVTAGYAYLGQTGYLSNGGATILNYGAINVEAGRLTIEPQTFDNFGAITVSAGATLTLDGSTFDNEAGGSITLADGANLTIGNSYNDTQINIGVISADDATVTLYNLEDIAGSLTIEHSTIALYGSFTAAQLAPFAHRDDTIEIYGTLNNGGATLDGNDFAGVVLESGGEIDDGTILAPQGLLINGGTLQGVTVEGPIELENAYALYVDDGLTVTGTGGTGPGSITVGDETVYSYADLYFDNTQTFDNATITLQGENDGVWDNTTYAAFAAAGYTDPAETLTLGPNLIINQAAGYSTLGQTGYYYYYYYNGLGATIVNQGTIEVTGGSLDINPMIFDNVGVIKVSGGATLNLTTPTFNNQAGGAIEVEDGGTLSFDDSSSAVFNNAGSVIADDATIDLYSAETITGAGSFSVKNSTIEIYNSFTATELSLFAGANNTIGIEGTIDNTGGVLSTGALGAFAGIELGSSGTILGGVLETSSGFQFNGGDLDDVVVQGALTLGPGQTLFVDDDLTVTDAQATGDGTVTLGDDSNLYFVQTQTFDDATLILNGDNGVWEAANRYYDYGDGTDDTLTFGAGVTIDEVAGYGLVGQSGYFYSGSGGTIVNNGAINVQGGELTIDPTSFNNFGAIAVDDSATLNIAAANFVNEAGGAITLEAGANLSLGGYYDDEAIFNQGSITGDDVNVTIYNFGAFSNTGTLALTNSTIAAYGSYESGQLVVFAAEDNTLDILGALDNNGATLGADDDFAAIVLEANGSIDGGVVQSGPGMRILGGLLDDVVFEGPLAVAAGVSLYIEDGLTTTDSTGTQPGEISIAAGGGLYLDDSQTLDGATVTLSGAADGIWVNTSYAAYADDGYTAPGETLTLGSALVVNQIGDDATLGQSGYLYNGPGNAIVNDGAINVQGGQLTINPASFDNDGAITVDDDATLLVQATKFVNQAGGTISLAVGASLTIGANDDDVFDNEGTIVGDDVNVTIYNFGALINNGEMSLTNSTIHLYGSFSTDALTLLAGQDDTIEIAGALTNSGASLTAGDGDEFLAIDLASGGTITGGTLRGSPSLNLNGGVLDGVRIEGPIAIGANGFVSLGIDDGLDATNDDATGPGSIQLGAAGAGGANLLFGDTQTFDDATLTFAGADDGVFADTTAAAFNGGGGSGVAETLTLGAGLAIDQTSGSGVLGQSGYTNDGPGDTIVDNATLEVEAGTLTINPATFFDNGSIVVDDGAALLFGSTNLTFGAGASVTVRGDVDVTPYVAGSGEFDIGPDGALELQAGASAPTFVNFQAATGTLQLDDSSDFDALVINFSGSDAIDIRDVGFTSANEALFTPSSNPTAGGLLTVSDGAHTAILSLAGDYTNSSFVASDDGAGGVLIVDPSKSTSLAREA